MLLKAPKHCKESIPSKASPALQLFHPLEEQSATHLLTTGLVHQTYNLCSDWLLLESEAVLRGPKPHKPQAANNLHHKEMFAKY